MSRMAVPLSLALLVVSSHAYVIPSIRTGRTSPLRMMTDEADTAAEAPEAPAAPTTTPSGKPVYMGQGPDDKFLGVFDTTQPGGAAAASILVSGGFCLVVEFIKFLDPNPKGDPSIFGSFAGGGPM